MRFSPGRFNRHLNGPLSQSFAWRRRFACPCLSPHSGSPKANCPVCFGKGHIWDAEVTDGCRAGISSQSPTKAIATFGAWESGDATLSVPVSCAFYGAGQYDRIRSLDSTNPFSVSLTRGQHDRINGKVVELTRVFWLDDDETTIVEGGIPDIDEETGALTWDEDAPPDGRVYSISGVRFDEWFIFFAQSSDRNIGVSGLPRKMPVRRLDILGRR